MDLNIFPKWFQRQINSWLDSTVEYDGRFSEDDNWYYTVIFLSDPDEAGLSREEMFEVLTCIDVNKFVDELGGIDALADKYDCPITYELIFEELLISAIDECYQQMI